MEEMNKAQMERLLSDTGLGVLALADAGDAYAIPLYYAREDSTFYFHSRPGIKDDFIRGTKTACLVVTKVLSEDQWQSIQVFGKVTRLAGPKARTAAKEVLLKIPFPPEWQFEGKETPSRSARATYVWSLAAEKIVGRKSRPSND